MAVRAALTALHGASEDAENDAVLGTRDRVAALESFARGTRGASELFVGR